MQLGVVGILAPMTCAVAQTEQSPLAGPPVRETTPAHSLVAYDFDGQLKIIKDEPAMVALDMFDIAQSQRDACVQIVAERHAIVDALFVDHLDLMTRLATAANGGDQAQTLRLGSELYGLLRPLRERGTMEDEFARVLSPETGEHVRALVKQYNAAHIEQVKLDVLRTEGKEIGNFGAAIRKRYVDLGLEIELAFSRYEQTSLGQVDDVLDAIDVQGEAREMVRQKILDFGQRTLGKPTAMQGIAFVAEVMNMLDPAQRGRFLRYIREQERAKRAQMHEPAERGVDAMQDR